MAPNRHRLSQAIVATRPRIGPDAWIRLAGSANTTHATAAYSSSPVLAAFEYTRQPDSAPRLLRRDRSHRPADHPVDLRVSGRCGGSRDGRLVLPGRHRKPVDD